MLELMKRTTGNPGRNVVVIRGKNQLTAFDPIKNVTGYKDTVRVSGGSRRKSIIRGSGATGAAGNPRPTVITAGSLSNLRGPGSAPVARSLPSVPRRQYQPTVLVY